MVSVKVETDKSYNVLIGKGILEDAIRSEYMPDISSSDKLLIVTDSNVAGFYGEVVNGLFRELTENIFNYVIPASEDSKSTGNLIKILDYIAERHFTRTDMIIALGGGVTGDLAGFAAAVYMRGIRYIQIPTTLLAATDSSVGGKTAVNLNAGKNLMGTFYQPEFVICDYSMLDTLPDRIFSDGMAEVIKYGMIADRQILDLIESDTMENIEEILKHCISIKSMLVTKDEHDTGCRQLLNFGHTIAHAIEAVSGYTVSHGRAVGIGMHKITEASVRAGICPGECLTRLDQMLDLCGLDKDCNYTGQELYRQALSDKKRKADSICLVVPVQIGKCELRYISVEEMKEFFL